MKGRIVIAAGIILWCCAIAGCYEDSSIPESGNTGGATAGSILAPGSPDLVRFNGANTVVLVPGWAGSAHIMFNLDYFWQLRAPLESAGFSTDVVPTSCFEVHSLRSKELAAFLYLKIRQKMKQMVRDGLAGSVQGIDPASIDFNLICHSQGGIIARYMIGGLSIPDPRHDLPGIDEDSLDPASLDDLQELQPYISDSIQIDGPDGGILAPEVPRIAASEFVGSIAMLSTPNRGTYIAEWITATGPELIRNLAPGVANYLWAGFANGQDDSDFTAATERMTRGYMENIFNPTLMEKGRKTPGIKIFVYAAEFKEGSFFSFHYPEFIPSFNFAVTGMLWSIIHPVDGANDGIVPSASALWTPGDTGGGSHWINMGIIPGRYGIDHWMIINHFMDLTHTNFKYDATPGYDAPAFFVEVAELLWDQEPAR
jgi:hypothetical protein